MIGAVPAFGLAVALGLAAGALIYRRGVRNIPGRQIDPLAFYSLLGIIAMVSGRIGAWTGAGRFQRLLAEPLLLLRAPAGSGLSGSAGFAVGIAVAVTVSFTAVADVAAHMPAGDRLRHLDVLVQSGLPPAIAGLLAAGMTGQLTTTVPGGVMATLWAIVLLGGWSMGRLAGRTLGAAGADFIGCAFSALLVSLIHLGVADVGRIALYPTQLLVSAGIFATAALAGTLVSRRERKRRPRFNAVDPQTE